MGWCPGCLVPVLPGRPDFLLVVCPGVRCVRPIACQPLVWCVEGLGCQACFFLYKEGYELCEVAPGGGYVVWCPPPWVGCGCFRLPLLAGQSHLQGVHACGALVGAWSRLPGCFAVGGLWLSLSLSPSPSLVLPCFLTYFLSISVGALPPCLLLLLRHHRAAKGPRRPQSADTPTLVSPCPSRSHSLSPSSACRAGGQGLGFSPFLFKAAWHKRKGKDPST